MTWILLVVLIFGLLYWRVKKEITLTVLAAVLLLFSLSHWASLPSVIVYWVVFIPIAAILLVPGIRQLLITKHLMQWFKASQPEISPSERDVLESGNIWVEKEFFKGQVDLNAIIKKPAPRLTPEELSFLEHQVNTLCSMLNDWEITHKLMDLPKEAWDYIKKEKFWGMIIDKQYGGLGFSAYAHSQVVLKIASKSMSAALTVMVPNSLGPAEFLTHYGTQAQKQHYLPRLVTGEDVACFGLTALNAGSDATSITDKGVICEQEFEGQRVLGIKLNFSKRYITLAPIATLIGLAFKLYDPDHLLGEQEKLGITLALVPAHLPGITRGARHIPINMAFMNGPIKGKDVFIPLDYVIGGVDYVGQGWRMLMECLSIGRSISLPALATASANISYRMSSAYAVVRQQFKHSIGDFEGIQLPLAALGGMTYICEAVRLLTLQGVDSGLRPAVASAIAKYHTTDLSRKIVNHAMDIHGGRAVQDGPRNYLANIYSMSPICVTVEGANILTRCLIIYGQGALRCHPYLQHEIQAAMDNDYIKFDEHITEHAGSLCFGIVAALVNRWVPVKSDEVAISHFATMFSVVSDVTMALVGKDLKFKESLSGRLADILGYLYMAAAVLKYYDNNGKPESEQLIMRWSLAYCFHKIENTFVAIFENYPKPWLGRLMKATLLQRRYPGPSDTLSSELATFMQHDVDCRERLTSACYIGDNAEDPCYRVEHAWRQMKQANTPANQEQLAKLIADALQVDEFEGALL